MTRNIVVENSHRPYIEDHKIEIVERKGVGHPDTLADGLSEAVSRALSKEYLNEFGNILHHNTDKVLIVGGTAEPEFRGGTVKKPIYVVLAGRATASVGGQEIPINEIAKEAAVDYLDDAVRFLDVQDHVEVDSCVGSGSVELQSVFEGQGVPSANDTSIGIGYAPLSVTEKLALRTEEYLNSEEFKEKIPAAGEDVKVMVQREDDQVDLTVAVAIVSSQLDDLDHYISIKEEVADEVCELASSITDNPVNVNVNTADDIEEEVIYQTVTGTSAEQGDDGMTGRGNRVNGLITFDRPMSLEAAAGKNPVNHVGKLYNLLSSEIAQEVSEMGGVEEVFVRALSQIGEPIDQPHVLNIQILPEDGEKVSDLESEAEAIASKHLESLSSLSQRIVEGKVQLY